MKSDDIIMEGTSCLKKKSKNKNKHNDLVCIKLKEESNGLMTIKPDDDSLIDKTDCLEVQHFVKKKKKCKKKHCDLDGADGCEQSEDKSEDIENRGSIPNKTTKKHNKTDSISKPLKNYESSKSGKKQKKCRKNKECMTDEVIEFVVDGDHVDNGSPSCYSGKKRKEKKKDKNCENESKMSECPSHIVKELDVEKRTHHNKKRKKKKKENNCDHKTKMAEHSSEEVAQFELENGTHHKQKRKKDRRKTIIAKQDLSGSDSTDKTASSQNGEQDEIKTKDKKKKRKHDQEHQKYDQDGNHLAETSDTMDANEMSMLQTGSNGVCKKMKKSNKSMDGEGTSADLIVQTTNDNFVRNKKSKKKKKDLIIATEDEKSCDILEKSRLHKKKKKKKNNVIITDEDEKSSGVLENSTDHSTKKRKIDLIVAEEVEKSSENSNDHKKTKRRKRDIIVRDKDEKSSDISEHTKNVLLSNISNDHGDGTTACTSLTGKSQSVVPNGLDNLGQWETASLGNENRQQKFLRLLGGFKKGGTSSPKGIFGNLASKTKGGNLALNHEQEETLTKNLMSSFQKALDYKLYKDKGVGLGFTPPPGEGKKFHIDTNVTKSHKFDD